MLTWREWYTTCRLVERNERLKLEIKIQVPEVIIRNERRLLQEALDEYGQGWLCDMRVRATLCARR